ncbi:MAG: hypothetical protein Q9213_002759 [Squamulea squamosa]
MDPQQRILLEITYEAFESCGRPLNSVRGSNTGVYAATFSRDYDRIVYADTDDIPNLLNKDGRSYSFDHRGSGYGRGEGGAVVIVKRLDDALRCGSPIRAVIRGTACNQDGRTSGITAPNQLAQEQLQRSIYERAGLNPNTVGYIEAHGTGTKAGDLAELGAIRNVFCSGRNLPLYVGSIKSNVGHLEAASGLSGLIKAVLVLEKGEIPPNVGFETPKPALYLEDGKVMIPRKLESFCHHGTRRVSVNSFGYGGTNAHVILEESPHLNSHKNCTEATTDFDYTDSPSLQIRRHDLTQLLILSARTKASLWSAAKNLREWIAARHKTVNLIDLASTLNLHRTMFDWRISLVAKDAADVMQAIHSLRPESSLRKVCPAARVIFIFNGQGAQWYGMGRELIYSCPQFKASLSRSGSTLRDLGAPWDLVDQLLLPQSESRINQSRFAQPASTALQIAFVDILEILDVRPQVVLGHSSGEIAAAYAAGSLSQTAAIRVAYLRGFVSSSSMHANSPQGAMLAVGLSEEGTNAYLRQLGYDDVDIACVNSPTSTVVSGNKDSISSLHGMFQDHSIYSKVLNIDTAYHSNEMRKVSTQYLEEMKGVETKEPQKSISFISSVTAIEKYSDFGPDYWVTNLLSKVRFSDALTRLYYIEQDARRSYTSQYKSILIEIGPHPTLRGPVRQTLQVHSEHTSFEHFYTCERNVSASRTFLGLIGNLFVHGISINLAHLQSMTSTARGYTLVHDLPSYAWDHSHQYWHESRLSAQHRFRKHGYHDLLGIRIPSSTSIEPRWRYLVGLNTVPWLADHVVDGLVVFPGAAYLCMVIEAMRQLRDDRGQPNFYRLHFKAVRFIKALVIPPAPAKVEIQCGLDELPPVTGDNGTSHCRFRISAITAGETWNEHCHGLVSVPDVQPDNSGATSPLYIECNPPGILNATLTDSSIAISPDELYKRLRSNGNCYGSLFALIKEALTVRDCEVRTRVDIPDIAQAMPYGHMSPHLIHPTTLDALMHASLPLLVERLGPGSVMPTAIDELYISSAIERTPGRSVHAVTSLMDHGPISSKANVAVSNASAMTDSVLQVSGLQLRWFPRYPDNPATLLQPRKIGYCMKWAVDVNTMSSNSFPSVMSANLTHRLAMLNMAALIYTQRSLTALDKLYQETSMLPTPRFKGLVEWMRRQSTVTNNDDLPRDNSSMNDNDVLKTVEDSGNEGHLLTQIGQNLTSILVGQRDPFDLKLQNEGLHELYSNSSGAQCNNHLAEYLKNLCFKMPRLRVLEVGDDLGRTASSILMALETEGLRLVEYTFTDSSTESFDKVKAVLARWASTVRFRRLDTRQDPVMQGFSVYTYDVVVAANLFRDTSNPEIRLMNIRKLLKPEGKLALIEITQMQRYSGLILGMFPQRWKNAINQQNTEPTTSKAKLCSYLSSKNFGGIDLVVDDCIGPLQTSTLFVLSATTHDQFTLQRHIDILVDEDGSEWSRHLASSLKSTFATQGIKISVLPWTSCAPAMDVSYVVIDDSSIPLLLNSTHTRFKLIINLLANAGNVLWISGHGVTKTGPVPEVGLITGLARTAHAENQALRMVTFEIQQPIEGQSLKVASAILDVYLRSFAVSTANETSREREYIYKDQQVLIPRLIPHDNFNDWIDRGRYLTGSPGGGSFESPEQHQATLSSPNDADNRFSVGKNSLIRPFGSDEDEVTTPPLSSQNDSTLSRDPHMSATKATWHSGSPLALDSNATYVIAGGLGDIGGRLVRLMVQRGSRHILVLSRRDFDANEHRRFAKECQSIEHGAEIHWWTCDISDKLQVMQCATGLSMKGLPPDRTLSSLTLDDFNLPLQAKVYGTQNLWDAFHRQQLDFFIFLSSLSGIVGPGGQGGYGAGNAFQDSFANTITNESVPCISLDIGFIENAKHVSALQERNLRRYGFIQLNSHELQASLEYAMNPQATGNRCRQIVIGCDWQSISLVDIPNATARSPLFGHVRQPIDTDVSHEGRIPSVPLKAVVAKSSSVEEVYSNMLSAVVQKISILVASDELEDNLNTPMTQLGLDSLITVELRNWISIEAEAATQVSEILDQTSVRNLAVLICSRSAYIQAKIKQLSSDLHKIESNLELSTIESMAKNDRSAGSCLPTLPVPDLVESLTMYFESRRFFLSDTAAADTSDAIDAFKQPGGLGETLQKRLLARSRDSDIDNWIAEPYSRKIYLDRRDPIHPSGTFYCGHILDDVAFTQAEKAALLTTAALDFKRLIQLDAVQCDHINGELVSLDSLRWLFNAVREPGRRTDNMRRTPEYDHIVALRRGHIFKICLAGQTDRESYQRFKAAFEHILVHSNDSAPSLATMTADERSTWAQIREDRILVHEVNKATMNEIETAAFVICFDDAEPTNASERCNQFFLGDPANRWSDKTLQFIVCKNGVSAFVCEHAMLDGMNGRQLNRFLTRAIQAHQASESESPSLPKSKDLVEELAVVIDSTVKNHIAHIQRRFKDQYAPIELTHHTVYTLGGKILRKHKCPTKAGYQVIIQLACLLYYGFQPESWETLSMSHFHKGRVDWIQAVQHSMAAFCAAAAAAAAAAAHGDTASITPELRRMFFHAVHVYANTTTRILRGHGFKAHLHALFAMLRDDEPVPALFRDQAWRDTTVASVKTVKTDCLEGAMLQETAFLLPEPKCIFVHYEVEDER